MVVVAAVFSVKIFLSCPVSHIPELGKGWNGFKARKKKSFSKIKMDDVRGRMLRSVHTRCVSNIVIVRLFFPLYPPSIPVFFSDLVPFF